MREIKFRGRDKLTGKWTYGNLEVPLVKKDGNGYFISGYSCDQYLKTEVDPRTVGQYSGITDKNGVEIYEGDFIEIKMKYGTEIFEVYYMPERARFSLRGYKWEGFVFDDSNDMRVIGNIYENPELLN